MTVSHYAGIIINDTYTYPMIMLLNINWEGLSAITSAVGNSFFFVSSL